MSAGQFPWNQDKRAPRLAFLLLAHRDYSAALTLPLAEKAVRFLQQNGCHLLWEPAPLVNAPAAMAAARQLLASDPDGVIICPLTWIEGDTALAALREIEPRPFLLWGLPMIVHEGRRESTGSFVAACSLKGPLERMGYRFQMLIGLPEQAHVQAKLLSFAHAAAARQQLRRMRLGLVGYAAMNIYAGTFDHVLLRRVLGPEIIHLDTSSLLREMEAAEESAARRWLALLANAQIETTEGRLLQAAKMTEALARLATRHHLHGLNVKCQYELSQEYGLTACLPLALLADTGLLASCEGDMMAHTAQALLHCLTGQIVPYADLLDLRETAEAPQALFSACGFAPLSLRHEADPLRITEFAHPGFSGLLCAFTLKRGPITFIQLSEGQGHYRLLVGTGEGVETALRGGRFPALEIALHCSTEALLQALQSQHFAFCYGDVIEPLLRLCEMLEIEAINLCKK